MSLFCVFFFKQKTAYEMRISDWSSDVCSSDLQPAPAAEMQLLDQPLIDLRQALVSGVLDDAAVEFQVEGIIFRDLPLLRRLLHALDELFQMRELHLGDALGECPAGKVGRKRGVSGKRGHVRVALGGCGSS